LRDKIRFRLRQKLRALKKTPIDPQYIRTTAGAKARNYPTLSTFVSDQSWPVPNAELYVDKKVDYADTEFFVMPQVAEDEDGNVAYQGQYLADTTANIASREPIEKDASAVFSPTRVEQGIRYYLNWKFDKDPTSIPSTNVMTDTQIDALVEQAIRYIYAFVRSVSPYAAVNYKPLAAGKITVGTVPNAITWIGANEDTILANLEKGGYRPQLVMLENVGNYFGDNSGSGNWNVAQYYDFNEDNVIDVFDLVMASNLIKGGWKGAYPPSNYKKKK
jgi:hypothetical protein